MFFSDAKQDEFVARALNFKRNGYYIDIGSCSAIGSNNTFFFEGLGWNGLCVELNSGYNDSYKERRCNYINGDALKIDYLSVLKALNFPSVIDYLSVDIDQLSFDALTKIPHNEYKFKIITIEHDAYHLGESYRIKQRDYLNGMGYELIVGNIFVEQKGYPQFSPFEDWWMRPEYFDRSFLDKIKSENIYPTELINKFA